VANIGIQLRSRLVKEALSLVLTKAGFAEFRELNQDDNDTVVVIDFEDCKDPEFVRLHQSNGAKIVALTSEAAARELEPEEIAPLSGILTYDLSSDTFVQCLHLICSGERVVPRHLALGRNSAVPSSAIQPRPADDARLSPREREALLHVAEGHSNKIIASRLGVAESTVKVHLKSVQRKIRVENRTQAAIWALANLPELDTTPRGGFV
jgi:two-component system nitrate/nitrite response regulator NarL